MVKRIGDLAKAAGVGVETVRFYEREGLIERPLKPQRGWREYNETFLGQLKQVRLGRALGLTLKDMKRLKTEAKESRVEFCAHVRQIVSQRLCVLDAQIADLRAKRIALKSWLSQCENRGNRTDCPLYAQIKSHNTSKPQKGKQT